MSASPLTTSIGSLPEISIEAAFNYSFKFDIPFFPQIKSIHGNMIEQVKDINFLYIEEFFKIVTQKKSHLVKVQFAGPTTTKLDKEHYLKILSLLEKYQNNTNIILCIDEPIINNSTIELIREYDIFKNFTYKAIHSCASNIETKISILELNYFDYIFYDSSINKNLHNLIDQEKLAPGCVDYMNNSFDLPFSYPKIITSTCGLMNCNDIELNLELLNEIKYKKPQ